MRRMAAPLALAALGMLLLGCPRTTSFDVGPQGGAVTSPDGRLTLEIPAGALDRSVRIRIQPLDERGREALDSRAPVIAGYRLEPDGLRFAKPVHARLRVPRLPDFTPGEAGLGLLFTQDAAGVVEPLRASRLVVDGDTGSAVADGWLEHFSGMGLNYDRALVVTMEMSNGSRVGTAVDLSVPPKPFEARFVAWERDPAALDIERVDWVLQVEPRDVIDPHLEGGDFGPYRRDRAEPADTTTLPLRCLKPGYPMASLTLNFQEVRGAEGLSTSPVTQITQRVSCLAKNQAGGGQPPDPVQLSIRPERLGLDGELPQRFPIRVIARSRFAKLRFYLSPHDGVSGPFGEPRLNHPNVSLRPLPDASLRDVPGAPDVDRTASAYELDHRAGGVIVWFEFQCDQLIGGVDLYGHTVAAGGPNVIAHPLHTTVACDPENAQIIDDIFTSQPEPDPMPEGLHPPADAEAEGD